MSVLSEVSELNPAWREQKSQTCEESGLDFVLDFDLDRDIKILQITDTQIIDSAQRRYDERLTAEEIRIWATDQMYNVLFNELDTLICQEEPDLILMTGDNVYGEFDDQGTSFEKLVSFMEGYQIPWAPVFGNHDNEARLGVTWQCQKFEEAKYCLFKRRNEIGGNSNYSIGIAVGGKIQRIIFMLDTNGCSQMQNVEKAEDKEALTADIMLHDTQLAWYQEVAAKVNAYAKAKIPSFMCFHVGDAGESSFNQKLYPHLHEAGTDGVFFGHWHKRKDSVVWQGIRWTFGLKTGRYDSSPQQTGGTVITLNKSGFIVKHVAITSK